MASGERTGGKNLIVGIFFMRKKMVMIGVVIVLLVATGLALCSRNVGAVVIKKNINPDDAVQIERSVDHARWAVARESFVRHDFKILFRRCIPDILFGHVCEIGALPDRTYAGLGVSITNDSSRAYAFSGLCFSATKVLYGLQRTTNGWEVNIFDPKD